MVQVLAPVPLALEAHLASMQVGAAVQRAAAQEPGILGGGGASHPELDARAPARVLGFRALDGVPAVPPARRPRRKLDVRVLLAALPAVLCHISAGSQLTVDVPLT